jgi:hypothetical protein
MDIEEIRAAAAVRHPGVRDLVEFFAYDHLPAHLQSVSYAFAVLAVELLDLLHDGAELTTALRKLLEAKDCAVRQAVRDAG